MGFESPATNNYLEYKDQITKIYPVIGEALAGMTPDEVQLVDVYVFNKKGSSFKALTFEESDISSHETEVAVKIAELVGAESEEDKKRLGNEILAIIGNAI